MDSISAYNQVIDSNPTQEWHFSYAENFYSLIRVGPIVPQPVLVAIDLVVDATYKKLLQITMSCFQLSNCWSTLSSF